MALLLPNALSDNAPAQFPASIVGPHEITQPALSDIASLRCSARVCTVAKQRPDRTSASSMSPARTTVFSWRDALGPTVERPRSAAAPILHKEKSCTRHAT